MSCSRQLPSLPLGGIDQAIETADDDQGEQSRDQPPPGLAPRGAEPAWARPLGEQPGSDGLGVNPAPSGPKPSRKEWLSSSVQLVDPL